MEEETKKDKAGKVKPEPEPKFFGNVDKVLDKVLN